MEHAIDSFREGETVILTLKDKGGLRWAVWLGAQALWVEECDRLPPSPLRLQECCRRRRTCW